MSRRIALLLAAALALAAPAPALAASTVEVTTPGVEYTGDAGVNQVTFSDEAGPLAFETRVRIAEAGVVAVAMGGCVQDGPNAAYCDIGDTDRVDANLEGGNDIATSNGTRVDYAFDGGEGDDLLTGADAEEGAFEPFPVSDNLDGGSGRDTLIGRGGSDSLSGDEGDGDILEGGEGEDSFSFSEDSGTGDIARGGPGFDRVFAFYFGPDPPLGGAVDLEVGTVSVAGASSGLLEGVEDASGTDGPDTILGTAGLNSLRGDEGNDRIDGRGGPDRIEGQAGDDLLEGQDGSADLLFGNFGTDTCNADQLDLRDSCEAGTLVDVPPFGTPAPPDRAGPRCSLRGVPKRAKAAAVRRRGIRFSATCDEAGRLTARLLGRLKRSGGGTRLARAGDLELAARSRRVADGARVRLRLRVSRRLQRLMRRGARLRLELRATDAASNTRVTTRRVRLR